MKLLIIGGMGQGKEAFVTSRYQPKRMLDGESCQLSMAFSGDALNRLHLLVRRLLEADISPEEFVLESLGRKDRWIVLCDEVGSGVPPRDPAEAVWREAVGQLCCQLARQADVVERICGGCPQRLKG